MEELTDDQLDNLFRKSANDRTDHVFWCGTEAWRTMEIQLDVIIPNNGYLSLLVDPFNLKILPHRIYHDIGEIAASHCLRRKAKQSLRTHK